MRKIKRLLFLFLLGGAPFVSEAQEFNAKVTVNSDKIQGTSDVFKNLQKSLVEFINNKKWTDATFAINERIECTFTITVTEATSDNNYKGEIQVLARRPVYNSAYTTTLINYRDKQLDFEYIEFQELSYTQNTLENNLTAAVVFYLYTILGLDFDSFSPKGGKGYLEQAQQIVNMAQAQGTWTGWKAFDSNNRHAVITALTDNLSDSFRDMWYTYHRKGLDEMAANPDRGRTTIISALPALQEIKSARPSSILLQMFSDAKLEEVVGVYSKATAQEKQEGFKMLSELYPTEEKRLEPLKK